jgi:hypothetical protein
MFSEVAPLRFYHELLPTSNFERNIIDHIWQLNYLNSNVVRYIVISEFQNENIGLL